MIVYYSNLLLYLLPEKITEIANNFNQVSNKNFESLYKMIADEALNGRFPIGNNEFINPNTEPTELDNYINLIKNNLNNIQINKDKAIQSLDTLKNMIKKAANGIKQQSINW